MTKWTTDLPPADGYYWLEEPGSPPEVVQVQEGRCVYAVTEALFPTHEVARGSRWFRIDPPAKE